MSPGKLIVGLTGGIGSGKTRVANAFAELGATVIDADAISHQLTAPGGGAMSTIRASFGDEMITQEGALNRTKMRELVFSDPAQRSRLEAILHPMIRAEVAHQTTMATGSYVIHVIPLLVETGQRQFVRILVVDCTEQLQIARVMQRDDLTENQVKAIMAQQATRAERLAVATDVIENETTFDAIIPQIHQLHKLYCQLSYRN